MQLAHRLIVALVLVATSVEIAPRVSAQVVTREYAIKASVIGVLVKCVNWPPEVAPAPGQPLKIGVLGNDPFFENGVNQLDRIATEAKTRGDGITVMRFRSAAEYQACHILFVPNGPGTESDVGERIKLAGQLTSGAKVLIVGEASGLAQRGAVANLVFDRSTNLIRLEINPDAAARAGVKLAPDLLRLKLVQIVRDPPR